MLIWFGLVYHLCKGDFTRIKICVKIIVVKILPEVEHEINQRIGI